MTWLKSRLFLLCFHQSPPQFLLETKRFTSREDSLRFSALCDFFRMKKSDFFKNEFLFSAGQKWFSSLPRICTGIFWHCNITKLQGWCPFACLLFYSFWSAHFPFKENFPTLTVTIFLFRPQTSDWSVHFLRKLLNLLRPLFMIRMIHRLSCFASKLDSQHLYPLFYQRNWEWPKLEWL